MSDGTPPKPRRRGTKHGARLATTRPEPTLATKLQVWASAAGRCTFCNRLVIDNEDLGLAVSIGELAHNVGWSDNSPRGESDLNTEERRAAENLLLLCRTCHKPADDHGVIGVYTVERLSELKRAHEARIRFLTEIGADRTATVVRVVGPIRGVNPHLTYDAVLEATTAAGLFPQTLPGVYRAELDLDLRALADAGTPAHFEVCAQQIDTLAARLSDAVRRDELNRLAVFAFARIPVLVHLGARLDDKLPTVLFQRHRVDDANAWRWPTEPTASPNFSCKRVQTGADDFIALVVSLSGTIQLKELPADVHERATIFEIAPEAPATAGPTLIDSPPALQQFESTVRRYLADVEHDYGKLPSIALFAAVPVSAAVTLGRVLMPHVSPAWEVYDRDEQNRFFRALEVRR